MRIDACKERKSEEIEKEDAKTTVEREIGGGGSRY